VAISDSKQLENFEDHTDDVTGLGDKLKLWDYKVELDIHKTLSMLTRVLISWILN